MPILSRNAPGRAPENDAADARYTSMDGVGDSDCDVAGASVSDAAHYCTGCKHGAYTLVGLSVLLPCGRLSRVAVLPAEAGSRLDTDSADGDVSCGSLASCHCSTAGVFFGGLTGLNKISL